MFFIGAPVFSQLFSLFFGSRFRLRAMTSGQVMALLHCGQVPEVGINAVGSFLSNSADKQHKCADKVHRAVGHVTHLSYRN